MNIRTYILSYVNSVSLHRCFAFYVDPPDPPTLDTITAVSSMSLSVSWTVGGNGGSTITGFLVDYRASSQTSYDTVTISLAFATMATVTGLSPYIEYNIRVRAVNAVGPSAPSDVLTERTLPEGEQ